MRWDWLVIWLAIPMTIAIVMAWWFTRPRR